MKQKKTKQLYIISSVLAVVILAGIGSLMLTPKKTAPVSQSVMATPTPKYTVLPQSSVDTSTWNTYTDPVLKYSIKYPADVMIQNSVQGINGFATFVLKKDQYLKFDRVTTLDIYDRGGKGKNAYEDFVNEECGKPCSVTTKQVKWISTNNAYGLLMPGYTPDNYYFADHKLSGDVIRVGIGDASPYPKTNQQEIATFRQMIATFQFVR